MVNQITIDVGSELVKVPIDKAFGSSLIKERFEMLSMDYIFPIPDKYCNVVTNYVSFLNGNGNDKETDITSANQLAACFDMESYFDHDDYFHYLLEQMFDYWSQYGSKMLYGDLNHDIRRCILLWSPYEFIPREYINNPTFFKQWLVNNEGTNITINSKLDIINRKTYYVCTNSYNGGQYKQMTTYSTETKHNHCNEDTTSKEININNNRNEVGYKYILYYHDDGTIDSTSIYVDGKLTDGIKRTWYKNEDGNGTNQGNIKRQICLVNGKMDDQQLIWYDGDNNKHQLEMSFQYKNGQLDGKSTKYNKDGTKDTETHYRDGRKHGPQRTWIKWIQEHNDTIMYYMNKQCYYYDDVLHGKYIIRFHGDEPGIDGQYQHGSKTGLWIEYHSPSGLPDTGEYVNDNKHGPWTEWTYIVNNGSNSSSDSDDDNSDDEEEDDNLVVEKGMYDNGKRTGLWITYDQNGGVHSRVCY